MNDPYNYCYNKSCGKFDIRYSCTYLNCYYCWCSDFSNDDDGVRTRTPETLMNPSCRACHLEIEKVDAHAANHCYCDSDVSSDFGGGCCDDDYGGYDAESVDGGGDVSSDSSQQAGHVPQHLGLMARKMLCRYCWLHHCYYYCFVSFHLKKMKWHYCYCYCYYCCRCCCCCWYFHFRLGW